MHSKLPILRTQEKFKFSILFPTLTVSPAENVFEDGNGAKKLGPNFKF